MQDCEWKYFNETCDDFTVFGDDECYIHGSYSPCMVDYWFCEIAYKREDTLVKEDCAVYFDNPVFWEKLRQEPYWELERTQQYKDFYDFWDQVHGYQEKSSDKVDEFLQ